MAQDPNHLIWIDMEMIGLDPDSDRILEVALVVTDAQLNTVAEGPVLVVHQPDAVLAGMDEWNKSTHAKSGLIERVKASALTEGEVERRMTAFLAAHEIERYSGESSPVGKASSIAFKTRSVQRLTCAPRATRPSATML